MGVFKEIAKADGSGTTTFYRLSSEEDTVETTSTDGTSTMIDYNSMLNKPSINDVALVGNKTLEDLGIQPAGDYLTAIPEEYITEEELEAKDYATETFVMEQINNTEHFHREIVDALPLTGKDNVLYLVPKKGSDKDIYNEYIWTGADYEFMGTTAVDLTDYYQKNEVDELLDTKVNKVSGKQLSTNDYTTAEKTKLASLENYDDGELRSKVDALHNYDDTAVKLDIQELKRDTSINEIDIASIENELGYKAEVIRLVKNGDWWLCQDAKGNNLTLEIAMNRLGLPKTILLLENLENDGKYYPVEYKLQEKYIDIIYKDLDGITHHLNYGYNEYFTNTASGDYIHLEDSINYPYKELSVDGVCEQETTTGKNLFDSSQIVNVSDYIVANGTGIKIIKTTNGRISPLYNISLKANTEYTISCNLTSTTIYPTMYCQWRTNDGSTLWAPNLSNGSTTFTPSKDIVGVIFYLQTPDTDGTYVELTNLQIEEGSTATSYEPYTGGQPSPSPEYPQEIKTIENSLNITSCNKNLFNKNNPFNYGYGTEDRTLLLDDGTIQTKANFGSNRAKGQLLFLKNNTIYTISGNLLRTDGIGTTYNAVLEIMGEKNGKRDIIKNYMFDKSLSKPFSFKMSFNTTDYTNISIHLSSWDVDLNKLPISIFDDIQIEENSQQTEYEQHLETHISTNLPEGEFIGKINDTYKDTLKVEYNETDGQYHLNLYKNIRKVILDGSEGWIKGINAKGLTYFYHAIDDRLIGGPNPFVSNFTVGSLWTLESYINIAAFSGGNTAFNVMLEDTSITTAQEFKTWLSTHNTEVYYALATPYVVDLGIVDMPITYDGVTNLYTNSDLMPTVNVEYYTEILENAKDNIIGQDIYLQDEVDTLNDLPTKANKGDIRKVKDTESWYIYDGTIWSAFDKASEIDLTNYLSKDNTIPYAPSTDYNPATKRYVDTKVDALFIPTKTSQLTNDSGFVLKSVNDLANYYNKSNTYNKAEVNALVAGGGGGSNVSITVNGDTLVITTK